MVYLKSPSIDDKQDLLEYIAEFQGEVIHGGSDIKYAKSIEDWLEDIENNGQKLVEEKSLRPFSVFLLKREEDDKLLGMVNIVHSLNKFLLKRGGHIGYSISPRERRKGYGNEILKLALLEGRKLKLDRVLVTCDEKNIASKKIIIKNGGKLENSVDIRGSITERYWIDNR